MRSGCDGAVAKNLALRENGSFQGATVDARLVVARGPTYARHQQH